MFRTAAAVMFTLSVSCLPVFAADSEGARPAADEGRVVTATNPDASTAAAASRPDASLRAWASRPVTRPRMLHALYGSLSALQAYDVYSTRQGLAHGAREANPSMKSIVGNPLAFIAVKSAATVVPMLIADRMWRKHRAGAILTMVVANSVMAAVAANNARVLHHQR